MNKKFLSFVMTFFMMCSMVAGAPMMARAEGAYDGEFNIETDESTGSGFRYEGGQLWLDEDGTYLVYGDRNKVGKRIRVSAGVTATVTIKDINLAINLPFECGPNSNVTLILADDSENTFSSYGGHAGLRVDSSAVLTITTEGQSRGNGSLSAYGGADSSSSWASAGIGGSESQESGKIVIDGGTIFARGGDGRPPGAWRGPGGAGIGGASGAACGDITINGGNVTASGGNVNPEGAGIGGGSSDPSKYAGKISINGGTVRAYSGQSGLSGTGIGFCSSIAIADTADVQAYSSGDYPAIYSTTQANGHSAFLLNFMLDEALSQDTDITIRQIDDKTETFEMTLLEKYKNFAATVETDKNYNAGLSDGSKVVAAVDDDSIDFSGILDSPEQPIAYYSARLLEVDTTPPVLTGGSVFRSAADTAVIKFISDEDGTYYYSVSTTAVAPTGEELLENGTKGGEVTAGSTVSFSPVGLEAGAGYVHIAAKDLAGNISDVLTVAMPYDLYFYDDFECYPEDSYPGFFTIKYGGAGNEEQKVISREQAEGSDGKVFRLKGRSSWASDQRLALPEGISGVVTFEAEAKPVADIPGGIALGQNNVSWTGGIVRVEMNGGVFRNIVGDSGVSVSDVPYNLNTWYDLKIVLDYENRVFDYYVDGEKVNDVPVAAHASYILDYLGLYAGNASSDNEIYYDNVKFYPGGSIDAIKSYDLTAPDAITANGLTAAVIFSPESPVEEGTDVTVAVTLTGTSTDAAIHTIDLTSIKADLASSPETITVAAGQDISETVKTLEFSMPSMDVEDFVLTHSFEILDITSPVLTVGTASRISDTEANVTFTSDEAGEYYYQVTEPGAGVPVIDTSGPGTTCDTSEQTISLGSLSAGDLDIYIVVKDAAGNVSEALQMEIPAYIPPVPAGLKATAGNGQVVLNWEPVKDAWYKLYYSTKDGAFTEGSIVEIYDDESYTMTGLENGTTYYFAIKSGHSLYYSALSPSVSATPKAPATGGSGGGGGYTPPVKEEPVVEEPADKEPVITETETPGLNDISGHWAQNYIEHLVKKGAITGYPDKSFQPDATITRAEFAVVLVKALGLSGEGKVFADTAAHWAKEYIATAAAHGIILGYSDEEFGPDDLITREQMAVMIVKAAGLEVGSGETGFTDKTDISPWAREWVLAAVSNDLMSGYPDNSFKPQNNASRAEAVAVIFNVLK